MAVRTPGRVRYPESDGKPLGETQTHVWCIFALVQMLEAYFAAAADVWVGSNQMVYYQEGNPRRVFAPDVCVVRGVPKLPMRRTYKLWEEGRPPTVVVEVTSRQTWREDTSTKRALYERLEVQEYVLFDPLEEYLRPRLQGFALGPSGYAPIETSAEGRLPSAGLELELAARGHELLLFDPRAGRWLPTPREEAASRQAEAEARTAEAEARRAAEDRAAAAEAELARLRAELDQLRGTGK